MTCYVFNNQSIIYPWLEILIVMHADLCWRTLKMWSVPGRDYLDLSIDSLQKLLQNDHLQVKNEFFCIWIYYEVDSTWWKQEQFSWSTDTWSTNWTFKPRQFQSNQGSLALLVRTHSYAESIYLCQGGCFTKLCLSVCLLATLHKSSWKFHICRIIVRFWRSSGSGSRKFYYEILPSWNMGNSENFCR